MRRNPEQARLKAAREKRAPWKKWGPYLSEHPRDTVRQDCSEDDGRDPGQTGGIAGICDEERRLCFALTLWNGADPMLKDRLLEDVKEYYFQLDNTPTHSYMKYLYQYPQVPYPRELLPARHRGCVGQPIERKVLDTGVFDDGRYFDVLVEYAKAAPEDILIKISIANRGPELARLHVLPTLWFRNTWSGSPCATKPLLSAMACRSGVRSVQALHTTLRDYQLHCEGSPCMLFTENESDDKRPFGARNATLYANDAFDDYLIHQRLDAVNPARIGTQAAAHYLLAVAAWQTATIRLRLRSGGDSSAAFGPAFVRVFSDRLREAQQFYESETCIAGIADDACLLGRGLFHTTVVAR